MTTALPGGSAPLEHLWHVSLLRLLSSPELKPSPDTNADVVARAAAVVADANDELRGYQFNLTRLLYVHETSVLALRGEWHWIPLGNSSAA